MSLFLLSNYIQTGSNGRRFSTQVDYKYLLKDSDTKQWQERLIDLKTLSADSKAFVPYRLWKKGDDLKEQDLKEWCDYALDNVFRGTQDPTFKIFLIYCTYNLGDKVTGNKITSSTSKDDDKLKTIRSKIASLQPSAGMSSELLKVRATLNPNADNAGNEVVKNWCLKMYGTSYWEGERYLGEVQEHCILNN
ncbi:hypothetical protein HF1_13930 [Mycoplasma haemofelis str. Langford 1]|uniref:Uncharacterized protein n=1 Tax=Mycoplasma haemofelis (strain Langford 1) TaxID=941640 RepID=E8ZJT0_MYCHL|nr:hypothetical protein [Mycoplasma haemofelis]CBY93401.1 hypothetical protein HF1_13930 [Mycoplasma haemofelis str. Langford 1]